uniref:Uncharacterized protein n=1 Tax=Caenorhabditis tropicalis TaxID=1561998 RepID=A0A1I7TPL6_9PELO
METSWVLDSIPEQSEEILKELEKEKEEHQKTKSVVLEKDQKIEQLEKELSRFKKINTELLEVGNDLGKLLQSEFRHRETKENEIERLKEIIEKRDERIREMRREISGLNTTIFFHEYEMKRGKEKMAGSKKEILDEENQENVAPNV